jgi:hypothetical protein
LFGLSFLARVSTIGLLVYLVAGGLFCAAVHITVLVFAFGEDVGTGVLTLCFWPYAVYFVYFKNENTGLKVFYAIGFMVGASFKLLKVPLVDG